MWESLKQCKSWSGEFINKNKNGETFIENAVVAPITNASGAAVRYLALKEDITERKRIEKELINAKEKAEEMSRLKSNFLANMSHELRTPLVGIMGLSEILLENIDDPELKDITNDIFKSGMRLSDTLNLILDFSKMESEDTVFNFSEIDIVEQAREAVQLFNQVAVKKGLYLKINSNKPVININSDQRALRSILNNLINNAVKYTNTGGIVADIQKNNHFVHIKISDTGIGIPKEYHQMIFEEFRQVSEGMSRNFEGTGLGLNITKKIVTKLGGDIRVDSEVGKGSIFTVSLPINGSSHKLRKNQEQKDISYQGII